MIFRSAARPPRSGSFPLRRAPRPGDIPPQIEKPCARSRLHKILQPTPAKCQPLYSARPRALSRHDPPASARVPSYARPSPPRSRPLTYDRPRSSQAPSSRTCPARTGAFARTAFSARNIALLNSACFIGTFATLPLPPVFSLVPSPYPQNDRGIPAQTNRETYSPQHFEHVTLLPRFAFIRREHPKKKRAVSQHASHEQYKPDYL